jgi:hypothetical protein
MTQTKLSWLFEILWLAFGALLTLLVLTPVIGTINEEYLTNNALFIFLSVTFFRLFLFVKRVPYLSKMWMRVVLIGVLGVLFFQFMISIQEFLWDMDNATISRFLTSEKSFEHSQSTIDTYYYFKSEFILFATACQMMTILLALRLVASMWQYSPKAMNH